VEDPAEVRVDDGSPVLVRHPHDEAVARQARVVDEDVDVAGFFDEAAGVVGVGDIRLDGASPGFDGYRFRLLAGRAVADDDGRTRPPELERDRPAYSSRGARDERCLALERAEVRQR
jgi:hypothetical protein